MGARWAMLYNYMQKKISVKIYKMLPETQLYLQTRENVELRAKLPLVTTLVISNMEKRLLCLENYGICYYNTNIHIVVKI